MQGIDCVVGASYTIEGVRDKMVDRQSAIYALLDQPRDVPPGLKPPERRSLPRASRDQLEWTGTNLVPGRRDTDDARRSPTPMGAFEGRSHYMNVAGAVEGIVHTPLRHCPRDVGLYGNVEAGTIDGVGGA